MAGGGIRNGEVGSKISTGDLVKKTEVETEASAWIKVFCGKIWVTGNVGYLGTKSGMARVGEFGD